MYSQANMVTLDKCSLYSYSRVGPLKQISEMQGYRTFIGGKGQVEECVTIKLGILKWRPTKAFIVKVHGCYIKPDKTTVRAKSETCIHYSKQAINIMPRTSECWKARFNKKMYFVPFGICAVYKYTGLSTRLAGGGRIRGSFTRKLLPAVNLVLSSVHYI